MATVTDTYSSLNNFQNKTFTSSKTITTADTYELTLNASFPVFWNTPLVSAGTVQLISGGGSSSSQAVYRITNLQSGSQSLTVALNQSGGGGSTSFNTFNYTVSAPSITAPTISSVTNNNASAASVTATVNLSSNGSGGTLKYAQTTSNSVPASGWQTSASFSHPRNSIRYYWASQDEDTSGAFDSSGAVYVGYIAPDTAVSPSNATITYNASSASITITGVTSGETYQLRNQTGTVQYQSGTASSTSITISQTGGLPSVGSSLTYQVFALRPTSLGGDGAYDATGDTYTITRSAAPPSYSVTAPASINEGSSGTINISTANVSNGTVLYWSVSTGDTPVDFDSPASGSVTINNNAASFSVTPTADATTEGAETASVTIRTGSQGGTIVATDTFTINDTSQYPVPTTPTDISFAADPGTASATVSIACTASGGSNGTLQVSENNSTWVANGSSFTFTRGTAKTIYARRTGAGGTSSSYSESHTVGYLIGDTAVSATSSTIAFTATSASTTVSGGQSAETYAVRVNNGATNLGTRTGNGSISFSSSLPSGGNTTTYEIFVRRPTSTGGDGSTFTATNDTFTVTRTAADGTPNAFSFTDVTNVALSTTQTSNQITISGIDTTVAVSITGGTYSKNGGSYTSSAGTAVNGDTFTVRHTSSSSYSTAVNTTLTVGGVSDTYTSTTLAAPTYSINAPASINEGSAGTINVTTTNVANGTTLYWDVDQTTDYATSQGSVSISSNAGSFTITPTADSTTEGAETDTIRLYSDSGRTTEVANDSFTINDTSTGSGGSVGGSDGNVNYGVEITGPNGTTNVFGVNLRQINAIVLASVTLAQGGSVSYTGIANATDSTKVAVALFPGTPGFFQVSGTTVSRSTANGGTITLTNAAPFSLAIKVSIYRIA